jgi:hypothetical protein
MAYRSPMKRFDPPSSAGARIDHFQEEGNDSIDRRSEEMQA